MIVLGCFRRLTLLLVLVVAAGAAWLFRDRLLIAWNDLRGTAVVEAPRSSPEIAEQAEAKLAGLTNGDRTRVALAEIEVQSLLEFRYRQLLPAFVDSPRVEIRGDRLGLRVRMPSDRLPRVEELGDAAHLLPDTTEVSVRGTLLPLDGGRVALAIDEVRAARIPLPARILPSALERLGRRDEPGLPPDALAVPLPPGVAAAYVRRDSLVLLSRPDGTRDED